MKSYKNNNQYFLNELHPLVDGSDNVNAFNIYSQEKFNSHIKGRGAEEIGDVSKEEASIIALIKDEIEILKSNNLNISRDRLEFDLAIIFHRNLKRLGWGRHLLDDYNMWRWLSMNNFLKEVYWRRAEEKFKKGLAIESASVIYDHLIGKRTRDIFPRRYFFLGDRLYDENMKYDLLEKLSMRSKESKLGGYGNLILNLIDTKLISPSDHVSKTISEILFTQGKLADDKEVVRAFVRYNGYKRRLLSNASKEIFEKEICVG